MNVDKNLPSNESEISRPEREVRARHTDKTLRIYQAYSPAIAGPAVKTQRFVPPFRMTRMTWIKPSFFWVENGTHLNTWIRGASPFSPLMDELNSLYIQMLHVGMLVLRQALSEDDKEWAYAEVELLHNVPSLINEADAGQHLYFWEATRAHHVEWASEPGRERAKSRMATYYQPLWNQMEPLIRKMNQQSSA